MEYTKDFFAAISDILAHPHVQNMKTMRQHNDSITLYDHSIHTAYRSFRMCQRLGLDAIAAARGAMLHDFRTRVYKTKKNAIKVFFTHCDNSLKEATDHFDLSPMEQDIIKKHMWPVVPHYIPAYWESLIVDTMDTVCATIEMLSLYRKTKIAKADALYIPA